MQVTVEYAAQVKKAAGCPEETVELAEGSSTGDLVQSLVEQHGHELASVLCGEDGGLSRSILVFVGETQALPEHPLPLKDNDRVTILSPISGG
jgi:molybdopterin converting factor small subunit